MSNVIASFLVGIGYDYDSKGEKQIESGIDSIKSKALQLGAVVAGAFGIKALTSDFAQANDQLGKFSEVFGITANDAAAFGRALEHEGGTLDSFLSQIQNIDRLRAGLLKGDAGFIAQAGLAGIDANVIINAKDAASAYAALADQFARMSKLERINAADALGLDEASIRLLSKGTDEVNRLAQAQRDMRPVTMQMTEASKVFNDEMQDLFTNVGGLADRISVKLLPQINDIVAGMNDWVDANRGVLNSGVDEFISVIAENFKLLAASAGLLTASGVVAALGSMAATLPIIGGVLATIAGGAAAVTGVGAAALGGSAAGDAIYENLLASTTAGDVIGETVAKTLSFFGNEEATQALRSSGAFNSQQIKVDLHLDGQVIDSRVIDTMGRQNQQAIDDLTSTVDG